MMPLTLPPSAPPALLTVVEEGLMRSNAAKSCSTGMPTTAVGKGRGGEGECWGAASSCTRRWKAECWGTLRPGEIEVGAWSPGGHWDRWALLILRRRLLHATAAA